MTRRTHREGFLLFEAMIAVAMLAIGILALGSCVQNCLVADRVKEDDARARRFLANRMAEIEAGAVVSTDKQLEELKGEFKGMTLRTSKLPLKKKNEKGVELFGMFAITLRVNWEVDGSQQTKELSFYVYPRQR